jgi:hypothetical protein
MDVGRKYSGSRFIYSLAGAVESAYGLPIRVRKLGVVYRQ